MSHHFLGQNSIPKHHFGGNSVILYRSWNRVSGIPPPWNPPTIQIQQKNIWQQQRPPPPPPPPPPATTTTTTATATATATTTATTTKKNTTATAAATATTTTTATITTPKKKNKKDKKKTQPQQQQQQTTLLSCFFAIQRYTTSWQPWFLQEYTRVNCSMDHHLEDLHLS